MSTWVALPIHAIESQRQLAIDCPLEICTLLWVLKQPESNAGPCVCSGDWIQEAVYFVDIHSCALFILDSIFFSSGFTPKPRYFISIVAKWWASSSFYLELFSTLVCSCCRRMFWFTNLQREIDSHFNQCGHCCWNYQWHWILRFVVVVMGLIIWMIVVVVYVIFCLLWRALIVVNFWLLWCIDIIFGAFSPIMDVDLCNWHHLLFPS